MTTLQLPVVLELGAQPIGTMDVPRDRIVTAQGHLNAAIIERGDDGRCIVLRPLVVACSQPEPPLLPGSIVGQIVLWLRDADRAPHLPNLQPIN